MFKETMEKIGEPVAPSEIVESVEDGLAVAERDRLSGGAPSGLYPGRLRRRYRREPEQCAEILENGLRLIPCGPGPGGALYCGLEGDRVRGNARRRRKRDHRLQHGKHRSGGRSYR